MGGMARKPDADLASALAAMRQASGRGRGRKSAIYQWMAVRHADLVAAFKKEPPSWTGLAKFFADHGMMSADGLPPTAAAVRSTWMRVDQTATRRKAARNPVAPPDDHAPRPSRDVRGDDDEPLPDDGPPLPDFSQNVKG